MEESLDRRIAVKFVMEVRSETENSKEVNRRDFKTVLSELRAAEETCLFKQTDCSLKFGCIFETI